MQLDEPLLPGETRAQWGARTGRYAPGEIAFWERQIGAERRVMASAGTTGPSRVEATIVSMYPAYGDLAKLTASMPPATVSRTEQLERAIWGPTREQSHAEQDAAAEREFAEQEERDRVAASSGLTEAEYRALFGDR